MKMKRNLSILLIILGLWMCLPVNAQVHKRQRKALNVALNIDRTVQDSLRVSYFNLGLLTNVYQLKGMGVNLISSVVQNDVSGMQLSGLANVSGGTVSGLQLSGIANVVGYNFSGFSATGFCNIYGHNSQGMMFGGIVNVFGSNSNGVALSGLSNMAGGSYNGLVVSGLGNVSASDMRGIALSGLLNVSADDLYGVQLASLLNVVGDKAKGLQVVGLGNVSIASAGAQLAGLANIVTGKAEGFQLASFNYAEKVKGVQLGLVNYAKGNVKGIQLGLVNYTKDTASVKLGLVNISPRTRIQLVLTGGNVSKFNIGVRFLNKITYTMLGAGAPYLKFSDSFSGSVFYRAGLHWSPFSRFRLSGDLGYYHVENFQNKSEKKSIPARMYALQARVNVEYQVSHNIGLILSGGYGFSRPYNQDRTFERKPIVEFGLVFF